RLSEQYSIDSLRKQQFQRPFLLFQGVVAITKQQVVAVLLCGILRAADNRGEKGVSNVGNHHAYRVRSLVGQTSGQKIGPVVKLLNGCLDPFAQFLANMALL